MSTSTMTVPNLSAFTAEQVADWYFLTRIGATDSASAGTAISTGYKTDDGNIAWLPGDPADGALITIAETLRGDTKDTDGNKVIGDKYAIGVVSTVPFSHATPAAFVSHNVKRSNTYNIAHEILFEVQPEVVVGGGLDSYFAKATKDAAGNDVDLDDNGFNDDYDAFVEDTDGTDYTFVQREAMVDGGQALEEAAADVSLAEGEKLFGLFGTSGGNFEYFDPSDVDPSGVGNPSMTRGSATYSVTPNGIESDDGIDPDPTLKEATLATLSVLSQDSNGFFVMFEQGDIDWSNHANDFASMIGGVADLDAAVRAAENFVNTEGDDIDWSNTLMMVTADHSNSYMRNQEVLGAGDLPEQVPAGGASPYGSGWAYPDGDVTYRSGGHTDELVTLQARGAGAELFAGHTLFGNAVDNTSIYEVMMDAAESGVKHIMLFIGDGMNISHEVAGSRYLYGEDQALAWDDWGTSAITDSDSWAGYATTWDVTTYNKYASANGLPDYDPSSFDPSVGYNPELGGEEPKQSESNVMQGSINPGQQMVGTGGADTIIAKSSASARSSGPEGVAAGEMGNDIIVGGDGGDVLRGDRNSRDAGGTAGGDDLIYGGKGQDRIGGKAGNDQLFGEDGNDQIWGDDGDDLLWGGKGNDTLTGDNQSGGKGSDTFVLAVGEGTDTITDFQKEIDKIGLAGNLTFGQLQRTGNTIGYNGETLATLTGVDTAMLTEASFVTVI